MWSFGFQFFRIQYLLIQLYRPEDRFKYIDDLSILHLILFSGLLVEYDVMKQVPSDIGVDHAFLPTMEFATQDCIDKISSWTTDNLMKLNEQKCNYMIFSRSSTEFTTRLHINDHLLEREFHHSHYWEFRSVKIFLGTKTVKKSAERLIQE